MLELKDIKKVYSTGAESVQALKGINLCFRDKEFVSILGQSGCGKTTMLNIIGGLDKYTSGDLVIDGTSTKNFSASDWDTYRNHKIGFVFQSYNLISHLSVLENVEIALTINGISHAERRQRAVEALQKVGLENKIDKRPNQLSGGQMQRVAIARAIVNKPSIILADEPTGALDSKTSVQVMGLIKEISKETLVIMVTHNAGLAKEYSTRIIKIADGTIKDDSMPFDPKDLQKEEQKQKKVEQSGSKHAKKQKKTAMSFLTAMYLSFKNLLRKKGRTILTSFAGSIGIIGIALVLAISAGLTNYLLSGTQNDALSGSTVAISTATIDYDALVGLANETGDSGTQIQTQDNAITPYKNDVDYTRYLKYGHFNFLGGDFAQKLYDFNQKNADKYRSIQYNYYMPMRLVSFDATNNSYVYSNNTNKIDLMTGDGTSAFLSQNLQNDVIDAEYEVVATADDFGSFEDESAKHFELTLVVDKNNRLKTSVFESIGYSSKELQSSATTFTPISFDNLFSKTYKLIDNNNFYSFDDGTNKFSKIDTSDRTVLGNAFENDQNATLKITKIIRQKQESENEVLANGLMYSLNFENWYKVDCASSQISQKQKELFALEKASGQTNYTLCDSFEFSVSGGFGSVIPAFADTNSILQYLNTYFKCNISNQDAFELAMQQIGTSSVPQNIKFYPTSFESKDLLNNFVEDYNATANNAYKILVTDTQNAMSNALKNVINIISDVLVAFASISLVVSSIMIGIITYVSVIERTKEIGILRSIGARKKDISRVFSAEAMIIGLLAGVLGVAISYVLCGLINLIISNALGVANIASLSPATAIVLIVISVLLTFVSGLIPSKIASNKDPVECLRNE